MRPLFIFPVKECSTRLPRKNLLEIKGRPLFSYPFEAMLKAASRYKDSLCVLTTESEEIVNLAADMWIVKQYISNYIADMRPEYLAKDPYQMADVCRYVLNKKCIWGYNLEDYHPLVVVQSTLPFITEQDIVNCIDLYEKAYYKEVGSVRVFRKIDRAWFAAAYSGKTVENDGGWTTCLQSLGGIIVCDAKQIVTSKERAEFPEFATPYILPKERAIDVDDRTDFIFAKALMEAEDENECGAGV